jgi:NhaP-type Na+/H+ or K+/H+ antiporter
MNLSDLDLKKTLRMHAPTQEEAVGLAQGILTEGSPTGAGKGWYAPEETWTKKGTAPADTKPVESIPMLPMLPDAAKKFFNMRLENRRRVVVDIGANSIQFDIPILLVKATLFFLIWFVLWLLTRGAPMEPGGMWFDPIACIMVSGILGGYLARLTLMPPLVGIMVVGIIWHLMPGNLTAGITDTVSGAAEDVAVSVIVMRAGLGLNLEALKKVSFTALALAFIPPTAEAVMFGLLGPPLFGFSFSWGLIMGFSINAAALIIAPVVMEHSNQGYGVERGVPALVIAGAALNVVYSIAGHGVMMSIVFSTGSLAQTMVMIPIQVIVGIVVGVCMAYVVTWMSFILYSAHPDENANVLDPRGVQFKSFILVFCSALALHLGFAYYRFGGSGTLANLCFAATVSHLWSTGTPDEVIRKKYVIQSVASLWDTVAQPVLFALVGVSVDIRGVLDIHLLPSGIFAILLCLLVRSIITFPVCVGIGLRWQDILYVTITTLPKATAQAALGARAYIKALELFDIGQTTSDSIENGRTVMSVTVMSILLLAPTGMTVLKMAGPKLLEKQGAKKKEEPEFPPGKETAVDMTPKRDVPSTPPPAPSPNPQPSPIPRPPATIEVVTSPPPVIQAVAQKTPEARPLSVPKGYSTPPPQSKSEDSVHVQSDRTPSPAKDHHPVIPSPVIQQLPNTLFDAPHAQLEEIPADAFVTASEGIIPDHSNDRGNDLGNNPNVDPKDF